MFDELLNSACNDFDYLLYVYAKDGVLLTSIIF